MSRCDLKYTLSQLPHASIDFKWKRDVEQSLIKKFWLSFEDAWYEFIGQIRLLLNWRVIISWVCLLLFVCADAQLNTDNPDFIPA